MSEDGLQLYRSAWHECPYLPERLASDLFVDPDHPLSPRLYEALMQMGFRRSGNLVYAPHCDSCQACVSIRVDSARFAPRRRHRRQWKRAEPHLRSRLLSMDFHEEHYLLYRRYTAARHAGGSMADAGEEEYLHFIRSDWCDTRLLELRWDGELLAVAVTDCLPHSLSAVYTFFDPEREALSPGNLAVMSQIRLAAQRELPWVYLGYWIGACQKMSYKSHYRPLQAFVHGRWRNFGPDEPLPETAEPPTLA